jgi:IS30 family transposase
MGYQRMTLAERIDIFRLLYAEGLKPSSVAAILNRKPSSIAREQEKGMDNGMYNPVLSEAQHTEARRTRRPRLKMSGGARDKAKPLLEKRRSPEEVAKWLKKDRTYILT